MIRCSSRILFASSYFSRGIKSPLNLQRATPGSFILRILFRVLQLRERLQFLQPRERVVLIKEYLILQDYLSPQNDQSEEDQELQLLQDLKLQEWYQGDLQGYSENEVKEALKKELISLSSVGHEVYDPVQKKVKIIGDQALHQGT